MRKIWKKWQKIEKVTYIVKLEILGEKSEICKFYHILVLVHILIGVIEDKTRTLKKGILDKMNGGVALSRVADAPKRYKNENWLFGHSKALFGPPASCTVSA